MSDQFLSNPSPLLLPKAIRQARESHEWTQHELAQKMQVSQGTVSFWERGVESPTLEHIIDLVQLMPGVIGALAQQEGELLARVYQLERTLNDGKCRCKGCRCSGE